MNEKTSPAGSITKAPAAVSTPAKGGISGAAVFTDMKFIIHVAVEMVLIGFMFYYFKSSDNTLSDKIKELTDQVDEQQDEIDKLKSTITHLTQTIQDLSGSVTKVVESMQRRSVDSVQAPVKTKIPQPPVPIQLSQPPVPIQLSQPPTPVEITQQPNTPVEQDEEVEQEFSSPGALKVESTNVVASLDDELADELAGLN